MQLTESYHYCPKCGSRAFQRLPRLHRACTDCGHRDFNNPITGVAALVLSPAGEMLWIERGREPGKGKMGMPGGFVDPGESLEQAAIREVKEETGLDIFDLQYLCSFPNPYAYHGCVRPVCDAFFTARSTGNQLSPKPGEVSQCFWQRPEAVNPEDLAFDSMRTALQCFLKQKS